MKRTYRSGTWPTRLSCAIEPLEPRLLLASTIYVDRNSPGPSRSGASWVSAYTDLQQALAQATSGTEIHVADGTYKPTSGTSRSISFQLKNGVTLLGSYAGYGAANPDARDIAVNATILSGNIGKAGSNYDNSYHVVVGSGTDGTAVLDAFIITAGNAVGSSFPTNSGGGLYNFAGSPTVSNCTFTGNAASYDGGGMSSYTSSLTLTNCAFIGNSADSGHGGGMYNEYSSPTLTNCTFIGNVTDDGGGIYNWSSSPVLANCTLIGNAAGYGGGMSNYRGSPALANCTFIGNSADSCGGGMSNVSSSSPTLANCTFSSNSAGIYSGGMYNYDSSSPTLTNCIIWGSGSSPIYNSSSSRPVITYSDIQGAHEGTGNSDADPLFVRSPWTGPDGSFGTADDDYGDLRLRPGSAALDIGSNAAIPTGITTDLAGNPRVQNGTVDLGAYEGTSPAPAPRTLYVDLSAVGTNTGESWANAFVGLQSALVAAVDGDSIRVADGTYYREH